VQPVMDQRVDYDQATKRQAGRFGTVTVSGKRDFACLSVPKEPALLRDLEANRTAVRGPRRDSLDRLLFSMERGRRRVKAEPETSKPSEPPERRVRAFCTAPNWAGFAPPQWPSGLCWSGSSVRFRPAPMR
jgi:hypothetical protein